MCKIESCAGKYSFTVNSISCFSLLCKQEVPSVGRKGWDNSVESPVFSGKISSLALT